MYDLAPVPPRRERRSLTRQATVGLIVHALRRDAGVRVRAWYCGVLLGALLVLTGCETRPPPQPVAIHRIKPVHARVRHLPRAVAASQQSTSSPTKKDVDAILDGISRAKASPVMGTQSNPGP